MTKHTTTPPSPYLLTKKGMYSRLSRSITARGSCTGLVTVGPTKFKACKSILSTNEMEEINNLIDKIKKLLVNFVGSVKTVTESLAGCM